MNIKSTFLFFAGRNHSDEKGDSEKMVDEDNQSNALSHEVNVDRCVQCD